MKAKECREVFKYALKIAQRNGYEGIPSFEKLKNKRASASYLSIKMCSFGEDDFHYGKIIELCTEAKDDIIENIYSDGIRNLINYIQEVKK